MKAMPHRNWAQTQSGAISSGSAKSNWVEEALELRPSARR